MSGEAEKTERAYVYMVRCAGGQLYTGWQTFHILHFHILSLRIGFEKLILICLGDNRFLCGIQSIVCGICSDHFLEITHGDL